MRYVLLMLVAFAGMVLSGFMLFDTFFKGDYRMIWLWIICVSLCSVSTVFAAEKVREHVGSEDFDKFRARLSKALFG